MGYPMQILTFSLAVVLTLAASPSPAAPDGMLGVALMSASVDQSGNLIRGSGVVSSEMGSTGRYDVTFERPLAQCTCTASAGAASTPANFANRIVTANCRGTVGSEQRVSVITSRPDGTFIGTDFHLIVFCPR